MEDTKQFEIINFTNIDSEDYVGKWGGKEETIQAGITKPLARLLAEHYAFHLAKKILIREGRESGAEELIKELTEKILGQVAVPVSTPVPEATATPEFEDLEKETETAPVVKKKGRPKRS